MSKLFLVDGQFEIFRCFYGAPRATAPDGREVGAVRGLLHSLVALFRDHGATHMAVAFDRAMAPVGITASRTDDDALLQRQFGLAADAVRALGIAIWPMVKVQADDAIATGVARYSREPGVEQTVIASSDNDFTQCVRGDEVVLFNRNTKTILDEGGVIERFGVGPRQIPDYLALVGDVSDGLPGMPGWGAKTAAAVLSRYGSIEAIPRDGAWDVQVRNAERLMRTLDERWLEAVLYRDLSILLTDVPIPHTFADLQWRGARREALVELCEALGETEVMGRVPLFRATDSERQP
jgi:5'-3' exonuclease